MREYFSILAVLSVAAMGYAGDAVAPNWFDVGDISSYSWPTDGSDYTISGEKGGVWSATAAAKKNGASLELVDENTDLRFTPVTQVVSTENTAQVTATILFTAFEEGALPTPTYDTLGSLVVVRESSGTLAYYGAGYDASSGENSWNRLGGTPNLDAPTEVAISISADVISYTVDGKLLGTTAAYAVEKPTSVTLAGSGAISSLAGYEVMPPTPVEQVPDTYRLVDLVSAYNDQYFVTPIHAHAGLAAQVKMSWKDVSREQVLIGAKSDAGIIALLGVKNGHWAIGYKADGSVTETTESVAVGTPYDVTVILENGRQSLSVNGREVYSSSDATLPNLNLNLYVFALNANGTASHRASANVRSIKLYEKKNN